MPLLARDFHRVSLVWSGQQYSRRNLDGPDRAAGLSRARCNVSCGRGSPCVPGKGAWICAGLLLRRREWFSRLPHVSYRIPGPPAWLALAFLRCFVALAVCGARRAAAERMHRTARKQFSPPIALAEWAIGGRAAALTLLVATHPFAPNLAARKTRSKRARRGPRRFDFHRVSRRAHDADRWRRPGRLRTGRRISVRHWTWARKWCRPISGRAGFKRIDVVALTHAHHDHLDGLHSVLEKFPGPRTVGRPRRGNARLQGFTRGSDAARRQHRPQARGDAVQLGRRDWRVLVAPRYGPVNEASNDDSLVLRITDGRMHFLLPGDAQQRSEDELVAEDAATCRRFPESAAPRKQNIFDRSVSCGCCAARGGCFGRRSKPVRPSGRNDRRALCSATACGCCERTAMAP